VTAARRDRGVTLIELLVTIAIMGIAFASILGGMGLFVKTESVQRSNARLDTEIRTYAEQLLGQPYVNCAAPATYAAAVAPAGYSSTLTVAYWDGNLPAVFTPACTSDKGLQQLTIVLRTTNGVSGTLVVGKSP
jgi:prepilin-type N-terminal cleavage/methylation domain-containing protein